MQTKSQQVNMASLSMIDLIIVITYLAGIFMVGLYAFIEQYRNKKKTESSYFLAGRDIPWLPIAATIFSSNIGAEHFGYTNSIHTLTLPTL